MSASDILTVERGAAVGVYVHIPFCKAKCKYCAFVSTTDMSLQRAYVNRAVKEIAEYRGGGLFANTVYIGGGTPSCLYGGALSEIFSALGNSFSITSDAEITVEINPESCTERFLNECIDCGVNRVSMGLQSACDDVLKQAGRVHGVSDFKRAAGLVIKRFTNFSTDIILGLPGQTPEDIKTAADMISEYCTHASVYALSVEDGTPLCKSGYTTDDDRVAEMYDIARYALSEHGFCRYEVSNFARNGMISKHNCKYWRCAPYLGFGAAAHGYDGKSIRRANTDNITDYINGANACITALTEKDRYNEYVMLRLRTEIGINLDDFYERFGYRFERQNKATLDRLIGGDLIKADENSVRISPDKMFVMNGIIEELME